MHIVFRLNAKHDTYGNPRKLLLVYRLFAEKGEQRCRLEEAIDEGFGRGIYELREKYPDFIMLEEYETTPKEYRRLLNLFVKNK